MQFAVCDFSYAGLDHFDLSLNKKGHYTSNLGDCAQTIASRHAFEKVGIDPASIIAIDRDTLTDYQGPPAALLMNAVFRKEVLPTPPQITPIFLGFNADEGTIAHHAAWLRTHAPIGCRDIATADYCRQHGIEAFVSGCVTFTLPKRTNRTNSGRLIVALGWETLLPMRVIREIPDQYIDKTVFIYNRMIEKTLPLTAEERQFNEEYEAHLFHRFRTEAAAVLTPLHHIAAPCIAMGIPVILCREKFDDRFGLLESIMPTYTPDRFSDIDWTPDVPDVTSHADAYIAKLRAAVQGL